MHRLAIRLLVTAIPAVSLAATAAAADWTRFRGPNGTGIAADANIPVQFKDGDGTSPVVYDGRLFVNFDQDRLDYKTHAEIPEQEHATAIFAFDAATGKPLWRRERKGQYACYSVPMMRDTAAGGRELIVMNT